MNLLLQLRNLLPCLFLLLVGCRRDEITKDSQLSSTPPSTIKATTADPAYQDFPSLLTSDESARLTELSNSYNPTTKLLSGGTYLSTLEYVVLLFKHGAASSLERGEGTLKTIISAQVTDTTSTQYGNWPWGINDQVDDRNPPLFFARPMLGQLWQMQARMLPSMKSTFVQSCKRLAVAAERRFDVEVFAANRAGVRYTNVYTMYIEALTLAGDRFADSRLKQLAKDKWAIYYTNFNSYGLDEFLSPTYDDVIFDALADIRKVSSDATQKSEVKQVMDYIYVLRTAVTHPLLNTNVVGEGRDYRNFVSGVDVRSDFLKSTPDGYTVPTEVAAISGTNRTYPFEVTGRAGSYTFTYKSYQLPNAAMGSMTGWGSYYSQQIHCMASIGTSTSARSTLFIPGSNIHINGFTDQKELSTLCVYNRLPTMWHRDQWKGDQSNISSTLFDFGVGLSTQWIEVSSQVGKVVLNANNRGYYVYLFPYILDANKQVQPCSLTRVHRTKSSQKYHVNDLNFDELVFPSGALWFGVYVKVVPANTTVATPTISFREENGKMIFSTNEGHQLKVEQRDGVSVQVRDVDPLSLPRFTYTH